MSISDTLKILHKFLLFLFVFDFMSERKMWIVVVDNVLKDDQGKHDKLT